MKKYIILIFMAMGATALWSQALQDQSTAGELSQSAEESLGRNSRIYGEMNEASSTPQVGGVTVSGTLDFSLANTFTISDADDPVKGSDGLPGYIIDVNDTVFNISSYVSDWSKVTLGVSGGSITNTTAAATPVNLNSFTIDSFVLREFGLLADQASNPLSLLLSTGYRDFGVQGYSGGGTESGGAEVNTAKLPKGILFRATPAYLLGNGDFIALDVASYTDWRGAQADGADFSTINVGRDQYSGPLVLADLYGGLFGFNIEAYYATRNTLGTNDGAYLVRNGTTTVNNNISPKDVMGFGLNGEIAPNWTISFGYDFIPPINDKTATNILSNAKTTLPDETVTSDGTPVGAPTTEKSSPIGKFGRQSIGLGTGYTQVMGSGSGFMKQDVYWRAGLSGNIDIGIDDGTVLAATSPYTYDTETEKGVVYNPLTLELSGRYMYGAFGIAGGYKIANLDKALNAKDLVTSTKNNYKFEDFSGFELALVAEVQGFTIFTGWVSRGGDINASLNPSTSKTTYGQKGSAVTDKNGDPAAGALFFRMISSF